MPDCEHFQMKHVALENNNKVFVLDEIIWICVNRILFIDHPILY
jgi:hypothetical protein